MALHNSEGLEIPELDEDRRPEYYIPLPDMVSRHVRKVFVNVHKRIAKMLQVSNAKDFIYI